MTRSVGMKVESRPCWAIIEGPCSFFLTRTRSGTGLQGPERRGPINAVGELEVLLVAEPVTRGRRSRARPTFAVELFVYIELLHYVHDKYL